MVFRASVRRSRNGSSSARPPDGHGVIDEQARQVEQAGKVTLRDIVQMKPGDVIPLNIPDTVQAEVDGIPFMECRYGVQRGQYALKVERFLAQEEETAAKG